MEAKEDKSTSAAHLERVSTETLPGIDLKVHATTWFAFAAICFQAIAQIMMLIGSGFMGRTVCDFFQVPGLAAWPSAIISIFIVSLSVPLAQAVDFWGRKWILVASSTAGFVGLLMISRAQSIQVAIAGFVISGSAFGASFAVYAVISEILPRKYRAVAQGSVQMATGLGAIVAILIAGALLRNQEMENFRIYYYVAAAIYGISTILLVVAYNPPPSERQTNMTLTDKVRSIDWIGVLLVTGGSCLFDVSLISIDNPWPFTSAPILVLFILGIVMLAAFVFHGIVMKKDGLLHHSLFKDRNLNIVLIAIFAEGVVFFTTNSYLIEEQLVLQGQDTWDASIPYLMVFVFILVSACLTGLYTTYTKRVVDPLIFGFTVMVVFAALMSTLSERTTRSKIYGLSVLAGFGDGAIFVNLAVAAQIATPRDMISMTTGLLIAARGLGGVVIIPVNSAIFGHTLHQHLKDDIASNVLPLGFAPQQLEALSQALAAQNETAVRQVPGATKAIVNAATHGLRQAYASAYQTVWYATLAFTAAALIAVCFLRDKKAEFDVHIDGPAEEQIARLQHDTDVADAARLERVM